MIGWNASMRREQFAGPAGGDKQFFSIRGKKTSLPAAAAVLVSS
jgi:hypothetical protein